VSSQKRKGAASRAPAQRRPSVAKIARRSVLAAGLALAQLGNLEQDSRFHLFSRSLLDRLHEPISRYHE
jgi:hypothetical protein